MQHVYDNNSNNHIVICVYIWWFIVCLRNKLKWENNNDNDNGNNASLLIIKRQIHYLLNINKLYINLRNNNHGVNGEEKHKINNHMFCCLNIQLIIITFVLNIILRNNNHRSDLPLLYHGYTHNPTIIRHSTLNTHLIVYPTLNT